MRRISIILFALVFGLSALLVYGGEPAPAPDPGPAKTPDRPEPPPGEKEEAAPDAEPEEGLPARFRGHGHVAMVMESGTIAMIVVDKGVTFEVRDRLLLVNEGPEVAYLVVKRVIPAEELTLCYCIVEKGSNLIKEDHRVINLRIRDEEAPPEKKDTTDPEDAQAEKDEADVLEKSKALKDAAKRIAELTKAIYMLRRRIEDLEQKVKVMDLRIIALERSKPDTSKKLHEGLDPSAEGFVVHIKEDKVAVSIGTEVGIRIGTKLYIYRPKGDGEYWFIGSINVDQTIVRYSRGLFIEKLAEPMERDIVTVLPKKKSPPAGGSEKKPPK
ncbi:MAG: hypothetical protein E3J72_15590 [Planctomycetota bacterium]|nr:MAG: hypothetical protein E3J72_15590 [Planctomycetota bacterium]